MDTLCELLNMDETGAADATLPKSLEVLANTNARLLVRANCARQNGQAKRVREARAIRAPTRQGPSTMASVLPYRRAATVATEGAVRGVRKMALALRGVDPDGS